MVTALRSHLAAACKAIHTQAPNAELVVVGYPGRVRGDEHPFRRHGRGVRRPPRLRSNPYLTSIDVPTTGSFHPTQAGQIAMGKVINDVLK